MSPIETYQAAVERAEAAAKTVNELGQIFRTMTTGFNNWAEMTFAHLLEQYPPGTAKNLRALNIAKLPTLEEVHAALLERHEAKRVMLEAWNVIPEKNRKSIKSPTDLGLF